MTIEPDLVALVSLAGAAADAHVLRELARRGHPALRVRHGYVFQRLMRQESTVSDLAAELGVSQQAMSKTVAELARHGYVRATEDPQDRRRRLVVLTDHAHDAIEAARDARRSLMNRLRSDVADDQLAVATAALSALLGALELSRAVADGVVPDPDPDGRG